MSHTIALDGTLVLSGVAGPEMIDGPGSSVVTISGSTTIQVLQVSHGVAATLSGVSISEGQSTAHAGGVLNKGSLAVVDSTFQSNSAQTGGAIYNAAGARLAVSGSSFDGNGAASGGGIDVAGGVVTITLTTFSKNRAQHGGAIDIAGGQVSLTGCVFDGNSAEFGGGAVANQGGQLRTNRWSVTRNSVSATSEGGGGLYQTAGSASLSNIAFTVNTAVSARGGGIFVAGGSLTLVNSRLGVNSAASGAGIANSGKLSVIDSSFDGNRATHVGGAILNEHDLNVQDCDFSGNTANVSGGAISNGGTATVSGCTLSANLATNQGGGIAVSAGQLTLINSTIFHNFALHGAGIEENSAKLTAINDTIADNDATQNGSAGGLAVIEGSATLDNTIVAQNTIGSGQSAVASDIEVLAGGSLGGSFNLIGTGGSGGLVQGQNGNQVGVADPGLGPIGKNGAPYPTLALLPGSPAIDHGSTSISGVTVPVIDQRGALRGPAGLNAGPTVDVGAYEASSSYVVTTTADNPFAVGTLRLAVAWASDSTNANSENLASPAPNTITFDAGLFSTPQTITLAKLLGVLEFFSFHNVPIAVDGPGPSFLAVSGGGATDIFFVAPGTTVLLSGLTIADGSSDDGAAVLSEGNVTIDNSIIVGNTSSIAGGGGALDNGFNATMTVMNSTLEDNSANSAESNSEGFGGAIYNFGTLLVFNSALTDNSAGTGGAIDNHGAATLTNVTIAYNSAGTDGGGIYNLGGTLETVNVTIAGNNAGPTGSGGGIDLEGGTAALYNTIVAQNQQGPSGGMVASDIAVSSGGPVSGSFNLVGTGGSGGLMDGVNGNQVGVADAGLGHLAFNGGPTATLALLLGSPAIDKASDSITGVDVPKLDQRGAQRGPRAVNAGVAPDVGAYEASSSYFVTSTDDSDDLGTLRTGVGWANVSTNANPEEIAFPLPNTVFFDRAGVFSTPQTITLSPQLGTLELTNGVTPIEIFAESDFRAPLSISGGDQIEVFAVLPGVTATLANFTIKDGFALNQTLMSGTVSDLAQAKGGAISNAGKLTLEDIVLESNSASSGGGIFNSGGSASLVDCSIEDNRAHSGGGIFVASGIVTLGGTTVKDNIATDRGGGVDNSGTLSLLDDQFESNSASSSGGAVFNRRQMKAVDCGFTGNYAGTAGGAVFNSAGAKLSISNSSLVDNSATSAGGGIALAGGAITLTGSTFEGNDANDGGAIDSFGAAVTLTNCTLTGNQASLGGAILDAAITPGKIQLASASGAMTLVNVTIAYNNVVGPGDGGGLEVGGVGQVGLFNTIVAQNTSGQGEGALPSDIDLEADGSVIGSFNLIGTGGSGGLKDGTDGNQVGIADPGLAALADLRRADRDNRTAGGQPRHRQGQQRDHRRFGSRHRSAQRAAGPGRVERRPDPRHRGVRGQLVLPGHDDR